MMIRELYARLYRLHEISKGRGAKQKFLSACLEANEYAREVECGALFVNNMREHYDCIMAKKVIENTKYL